MPQIPNRLIPQPAAIDDPVKAKAGQAERAWEAVTGALTFLGAGGAAALAAGAAIPPIAPFVVAVAAGSFYFKLRAKWVKEDPARPDYDVVTSFQLPQIDAMAVLPPGPVPPGASIVSLLHAAGASIEATVVAVERAMGASVAAWAGQLESAAAHGAARTREASETAKRSELLTVGLNTAASAFGDFLDDQLRAQNYEPQYPSRRYASLSEMFDAETLGHVIAAGVDQRLLETKVRWDPQSPPAAVRESLERAGDTAEELGAQLSRWAEQLELRLPPEGT